MLHKIFRLDFLKYPTFPLISMGAGNLPPATPLNYPGSSPGTPLTILSVSANLAGDPSTTVSIFFCVLRRRICFFLLTRFWVGCSVWFGRGLCHRPHLLLCPAIPQ